MAIVVVLDGGEGVQILPNLLPLLHNHPIQAIQMPLHLLVLLHNLRLIQLFPIRPQSIDLREGEAETFSYLVTKPRLGLLLHLRSQPPPKLLQHYPAPTLRYLTLVLLAGFAEVTEVFVEIIRID